MSPQKKTFQCRCRRMARWGSLPAEGCKNCNGTGYVTDARLGFTEAEWRALAAAAWEDQ